MEHLLTEIWEAAAPGLLMIISAMITLVLGIVARHLPRFLREIYEERLRRHIHATAMRAARAAFEGDWKHFDFDKDDQAELVAWITARLKEGAGDALSYFGRNDSGDPKLQQFVLNAIGELTERWLAVGSGSAAHEAPQRGALDRGLR